MPITWLDILLLGVMLISGLLAMIRGFMREILSITAWARGRGRDAAALHQAPADRQSQHFAATSSPTGAVIGGVFLVTLLIVSIITVRISDMILDSRIGALDRTLGFLFGLGRGLIIVVVAFLFFAWLVPRAKQPDGVRNAKSLRGAAKDRRLAAGPVAAGHGQLSVAVVQEAPEGRRAGAAGRAARPALRSRLAGRHRLGARPAGYPRSDRTDMRQLIDATKHDETEAMDG